MNRPFLDRNGNGEVDDGRELFGNATPLSVSLDASAAAPNGFAALSIFDSRGFGGNDDNFISDADAVFASLRVWVDANHDDISNPTELRSLKEAGVLAISLQYQESRRRDRFGNEFRYRGWFSSIGEDGVLRWLPVIDVFPVSK